MIALGTQSKCFILQVGVGTWMGLSKSLGLMTSVAPHSLARACFCGSVSTPMMRLAPTVASASMHASPIVPKPNTAAVAPFSTW